MNQATMFMYLIAIIFLPVVILFSLYLVYMLIFNLLTFSSKTSMMLTIFIMLTSFSPSLLFQHADGIFLFSISSWNFYIHPIGFLLPVLISCLLIMKTKVSWPFLLSSLIPVSLTAYLMTTPIIEKGIVSPFPLWLFPPLVAAIISVLNKEVLQNKLFLYAFSLGVFGVIIGADLAHLPTLIQLSTSSSMHATIGGAGSLDLIFLSGIFSVLFSKLFLLGRKLLHFEQMNKTEYLHM